MKRVARSSGMPSNEGRRAGRAGALALAALVFLFPSFAIFGAQAPSAEELLRKYAEGQGKLRSFLLKCEHASSAEGTGHKGIYRTHDVWEARSDGNRFYLRNVESDCTGQAPSHDNTFYIWDGRRGMQFHRALKILTVHKTRYGDERLLSWIAVGRLRGYVVFDGERIDAVLGKARSLSVKEKPETLGGTTCYVIEGDTSRGRYKLWIAPDRGYNIAKLTVERKENDEIFKADKLKNGQAIRHALENVRFEQVRGVWVPMEADYFEDQRDPGDVRFSAKSHARITEIVLDPDHEKSASFAVASDIPEGTEVHVEGGGKVGRWQDGRAVDGAGKPIDVDALLEKATPAQPKRPVPQLR